MLPSVKEWLNTRNATVKAHFLNMFQKHLLGLPYDARIPVSRQSLWSLTKFLNWLCLLIFLASVPLTNTISIPVNLYCILYTCTVYSRLWYTTANSQFFQWWPVACMKRDWGIHCVYTVWIARLSNCKLNTLKPQGCRPSLQTPQRPI